MFPVALQHIAGGDGWTAAKRSDNVPPQYRFRWCICGFGMPLLQVLGMENSNMVCKFSFDEDVWPHRVQPLQPAFRHTTATRCPTLLLRFVVGTLQGTNWFSSWEGKVHHWTWGKATWCHQPNSLKWKAKLFHHGVQLGHGTRFFFPRTFFLAQGLVAAVLLGSFQACAIYIPAAPDVQGNRAKSKPLLLTGGLGRGWRLGGGWLRPAPHW